MRPRSRYPVKWHEVVSDLAEALDRAITIAGEVQWRCRTTAAQTTMLAQAVSRAIEVLDRVPQPERRVRRIARAGSTGQKRGPA